VPYTKPEYPSDALPADPIHVPVVAPESLAYDQDIVPDITWYPPPADQDNVLGATHDQVLHDQPHEQAPILDHNTYDHVPDEDTVLRGGSLHQGHQSSLGWMGSRATPWWGLPINRSTTQTTTLENGVCSTSSVIAIDGGGQSSGRGEASGSGGRGEVSGSGGRGESSGSGGQGKASGSGSGLSTVR
jgi:hypothetical protein